MCIDLLINICVTKDLTFNLKLMVILYFSMGIVFLANRCFTVIHNITSRDFNVEIFNIINFKNYEIDK